MARAQAYAGHGQPDILGADVRHRPSRSTRAERPAPQDVPKAKDTPCRYIYLGVGRTQPVTAAATDAPLHLRSIAMQAKPNRQRDASDRDEPTSSMRRLAALLKPHSRGIVIVMAFLLVLTAVNMAIPLLMKLLVDDVLINQDNWLPVLAIVIFGFLGVYLARNLLYFNGKFTAVRIGEQLSFMLRRRLFERLQHMTLQFYRSHSPGQVSSRVMNDSFVIQQFIQDDLPTLLQSGLLFFALVAALYAMNWQLAMAATIVLPMHLMTAYGFKRPIKLASRQAQEQLAAAHGNLIEKFLGAEVVKGFTAEQRESEAFVHAIDQSRQSQLRSKRFHVSQKVIADLLIGVGTVTLVGFGAYQVVKGRMTPGGFLQFFGYVMMLYPNVMELVSGFAKLTRSTASIDRVFELLESDAPEDVVASQTTPRASGDLRFESVGFRYDDGPPVLKNINLSIPAGRVCAIVGSSGSGKSTLVSLVPRFIEPDMGRVTIDGVDIRDMELRTMREAVGIAFQECFLFNSSIFENLRYARPDATMNQIIQVAKRTGAHSFIGKMPNGYATMIGEDGASLSRGEKQRITLTRAMLKNPKILILDEATASIDVASESQIIPAILDFMRGKTTLMITHRPELLRHADVVACLDDGRLVYQGPPEELPAELIGLPSGLAAHVEAAPPIALPSPNPTPPHSGLNGLLIAATLSLSMVLGAAHAVAQEPAPEAPAEAPAAQPAPAPPPEPPAAEPLPAPAAPEAAPAPADLTQLIAQPGLNRIEIEELLSLAATRAQIELGYEPASDAIAPALPETPESLFGVVSLVRSTAGGLRVLQLGYQFYASQPIHLYLHGRIVTEDGSAKNEDLAKLTEMLTKARETLTQHYESLKVTDLATRKILLSYISVERCAKMLQVFGYTMGEPGKAVDPKTLPVILASPATTSHNTPKGPKEDFPLTEADPIGELLVFYHPAHPEQFSQVLNKVRTVIDVPARQIMIEAMVLEISETGLQRLGVEWELEGAKGGVAALKVGRVPAFTVATEVATADIELQEIFGEFNATIQALIREGSAEVLSRPSVLTLNNRMANMSVEERIPVVQSLSQTKDANVVLVSFKEVTAGIQLNVRPRVSADSEDISMQVVATVSARVPGEDVIVLNSEGDEVARAPTISARQVSTYTRIANNTPFIIGGLISKDDSTEKDKVPLLWRIPLLGEYLFTTHRVTNERREVIIVITPFVLPEDGTVGRNMPKDEDVFDSFGWDLHRDAYRIRAEDVFDLSFLFENRYLRRMRRLANRVIQQNFRYANRYPFRQFVGDKVPGEEILVFRQVYEVIKRLKLHRNIKADRIIFFEPDDKHPAGFHVQFLGKYLARESGLEPARLKQIQAIEDEEEQIDAFFDALGNKAIALVYTQRNEFDMASVMSEPVPEIRLVDFPECDDEDEEDEEDRVWSRMMWDLNKDVYGQPRQFTILLRRADDVDRIKRAIALKRTLQLNGTRQTLNLRNFSIGRLLLMPTIQPDKVYVVDADTAALFFYTEHYYAALRDALEKDLSALRDALKQPGVQKYLRGAGVPGNPGRLNLPPAPVGAGGR